jgi:hypothetical protein
LDRLDTSPRISFTNASAASSKNIGGRPINALWHQLSADGNPHKEKLSICQHCRTTVTHRGQVAVVRKHFEKHCNPTLLQKIFKSRLIIFTRPSRNKETKNSNRDIQHLSSKGNFVVDL